MHGPEQGKEAVPGAVRPFERLVAGVGLGGAELIEEGRGGKGAVIEVVAERQQAPLLGIKEEHEPHEHGHRALVHLVGVDAAQEGALAVTIGPAHGRHQQLDGLADLPSQRAGDLGLGRCRLRQQSFEAVGLGHGEEAPGAQDRREGVEQRRLLREQLGAERGRAAGAALRCPHQHPGGGVGGQAQLDARGPAQDGQPLDGGGRPPVAGGPGVEPGAGGVDGD